jgi:hypothetical protein
MAENVTIKIDVDADIASITAVRAALNAMCSEVDDCTKTMDKHRKKMDEVTSTHDSLAKGANKNTKALNSHSGATKNATKNQDSFLKRLFSVNDATKTLLGGLHKLIKFGIKPMAIEMAAAALAIASSALLFKSGAAFAKGYQLALSGVAYAIVAATAAFATFLAAQREFASTSFAPMFADGATNTASSVEAASSAMKMFVDDAQLAVLGSKSLTAAFSTLSKQGPVTGKTTAAFRALADVTSGMGGDIGKNSEELAKFMAEYQKRGTFGSKVQQAGKALGPEFTKILKEANAQGINTYDKFAEAAVNGTLGDTFKKYSGQLGNMNNTLVGQAKGALSEIKGMFVEMGEPLLGPVKQIFQQMTGDIRVLFMRINAEMGGVVNGGTLQKLADGFGKITNAIGRLIETRVPDATNALGRLSDGWKTFSNLASRIVEWLRPLQDAASGIWKALLPALRAVGESFGGTVDQIAMFFTDKSFLDNLTKFSMAFAEVYLALSNIGTQIKDAFVKALPVMTIVAKVVAAILTAMGALLSLTNKLPGALGGIATLGAAFIGMRALKMGGAQVKGKVGGALNAGASKLTGGTGAMPGVASSTGTMNVTAGSVYVNGTGVTGGAAGTVANAAAARAIGGAGAAGRMSMGQRFGNYRSRVGGEFQRIRGGIGQIASPSNGLNRRANFGNMFFPPTTTPGLGASATGSLNYGQRAANAFQGSRYGGASITQSLKNSRKAVGRQFAASGGMGNVASKVGNIAGNPMALMMGGTAISGLDIGGKQGNAVTGSAGSAMQMAGMAKMMGASGPTAALLAGGTAAWKLGGSVSAGMFGNSDSNVAKAGGGLAGAATGAAIGATIGSAVPVLGTALGAALGGAIGFAAGVWNAGKYNKQARSAAKEFIAGYATRLDDAMSAGDLEGVQSAVDNVYADAAAAGKGNIDVYNKEIEKRKKEIDALSKGASNYSKNAGLFQIVFGADAKEMVKIANKAGVGIDGLKKGIVGVMDVAKKAGINLTEKMAPGLANMNAQMLDAKMALFDAPLQALDMQNQFDAMQDKIASGDTSKSTIIQFLKTGFQRGYALTGSSSKATVMLEDTMKLLADVMPGQIDKIMKVASEIGVFDSKRESESFITSKGSTYSSIFGEAIRNSGVKGVSDTQILTQIGKVIAEGGAGASVAMDDLLNNVLTGKSSGKDILAFLNTGYLNTPNPDAQGNDVLPSGKRVAPVDPSSLSTQVAYAPNIQISGVISVDDKAAQKVITDIVDAQWLKIKRQNQGAK